MCSHLNISNTWKSHHFDKIPSYWFVVFFFFFSLLFGLVPGFGFPGNTAGKDSRCHGVAGVLRSVEWKTTRAFWPCVRHCTSSSQALSVWDIPEAERANPSSLLLITLNGSVLGGSSLFEKLTGGGQESIKTQITKALSWLEILLLFCSWSQTSSCKIPKRLVCNSHLPLCNQLCFPPPRGNVGLQVSWLSLVNSCVSFLIWMFPIHFLTYDASSFLSVYFLLCRYFC